MDPTSLYTIALKLLVALLILALVAHAWLVVTVIRLGEDRTRRYLNGLGCREDGVLGKLMLRFARSGLRA